MNKKYKTKIESLASELKEVNQHLVANESYITAVCKQVNNMVRTYGIKNVIFSDQLLETAIKNRLKFLHTNIGEFYSTRTINNNDGIGAFMAMEKTITSYDGCKRIKAIAKTLQRDKTAFVINPPFDGTTHLAVFNECKQYSDHIICVHPSTQLQALPAYKVGDKDYEQYIKDGLTEQQILPFNVFKNTDAYGDIVIDVWNKDKVGSTQKFSKWDYAYRCKDKELYPIIWDAIQRYNDARLTFKDKVRDYNAHTQPGNWNVVVSVIGKTNGVVIQSNNTLPYDKDGNTRPINSLGAKYNVNERYGGGLSKGIDKWKLNGSPYQAVGFDTEREAQEFIETWTTPQAKVINNCVTHDQHLNIKCLPYIPKGDVIMALGLETYKDRILREARTLRSVNDRNKEYDDEEE